MVIGQNNKTNKVDILTLKSPYHVKLEMQFGLGQGYNGSNQFVIYGQVR